MHVYKMDWLLSRMGIIREEKWREEKIRKDERHKMCERNIFWSLRSESSVKHVNTSECQMAMTYICESHRMSASSQMFNISLVAWSSPAFF